MDTSLPCIISHVPPVLRKTVWHITTKNGPFQVSSTSGPVEMSRDRVVPTSQNHYLSPAYILDMMSPLVQLASQITPRLTVISSALLRQNEPPQPQQVTAAAAAPAIISSTSALSSRCSGSRLLCADPWLSRSHTPLPSRPQPAI